jgi:hypothetical protein
MTKQNFIALADAIRRQNDGPMAMSREQVEFLADFCQSQNPAFKRERWLDYVAGKCGKNGGAGRGGRR